MTEDVIRQHLRRIPVPLMVCGIVLRRVPGAITSDRCHEAEEQADPLNHTEDCTADQLQARWRALERHDSHHRPDGVWH